MNLFISPTFSDAERRTRLFAGDILLSVLGGNWLVDIVASHITKTAFANPRYAHKIEKETYIRAASALKTRTANTQTFYAPVKKLISALGQDPDKVYFDPPRMRIAPPSDYLTSGVSYAYAPHRDTWYGHPICAVNYWIPIFDIAPENCLALFPNYFSRAIANTSEVYDHDKWVSEYRFKAAEQVTKETRPHPLPNEEIERTSEARIIGNPGDILIFSSQQLHATVPNTSGITRFSIDFRTVHVDDLSAARGAANVDCRATGSALSGYIRASDFEPLDISKFDLTRLHPKP